VNGTTTRKSTRRAQLAFVLLAAVFSARAQHDGPPRLVLRTLDTDHDGKLSSAELAAAPQVLLVLDRNGDGQLKADEFQPRPDNSGATSEELVTQLMVFDKNGDGVLTPDELPSRMQNLFTRADSNHDGKLTPDEIHGLAARQSMPEGAASANNPGATHSDPLLNALDLNHDGVISTEELASATKSLLVLDVNRDGEITAEEMRPIEPSPQERVDHLLGEWDTNKDSKISKAEAPDRLQQQFESIDKNGDGFLDKDELLQYFSTAGAGRRNAGGEHPKEQNQ
jgi:Ca2+-binding EF-hand superfamily protein